MGDLLLTPEFFKRDVLEVAPDLLGCTLVRHYANGENGKYIITEVEAYRGEDDLACHASKGRTPRTEVMYWQGGYIYVYLIYGMHYMLNFVTAEKDNPQAVLIRGVDKVSGPGRVTKLLSINKELNKQHLFKNPYLFVEGRQKAVSYKTAVRVGIDYAGSYWKNRPWRFIIQ